MAKMSRIVFSNMKMQYIGRGLAGEECWKIGYHGEQGLFCFCVCGWLEGKRLWAHCSCILLFQVQAVTYNNFVVIIGLLLMKLFFPAEYMPGGNLYDFLHKHNNVLQLSQLLKFAIDISKGMEYLHQNNIIHRDLKTANLLMDANHVSSNL